MLKFLGPFSILLSYFTQLCSLDAMKVQTINQLFQECTKEMLSPPMISLEEGRLQTNSLEGRVIMQKALPVASRFQNRNSMSFSYPVIFLFGSALQNGLPTRTSCCEEQGQITEKVSEFLTWINYLNFHVVLDWVFH